MAAGRLVGNDQRGWTAVETLPPFELREGEQHCLKKQMGLGPQTDLELEIHKQVAEMPYMLLHRTSCSE